MEAFALHIDSKYSNWRYKMSNSDAENKAINKVVDVVLLEIKITQVIKRYSYLLSDFGYEEIYLRPIRGYFSNGVKYLEINNIEMCFWHGDYGYQLGITRNTGKFDNINKCINTDEFVLICDELIKFVSNPDFLKKSNIKEDLILFLESNNCEITSIPRSLSDENSTWINVNKDGFYFSYTLKREDVEKDVLMPFDDYSEEDDGPITARYRQNLDNFKKTFDNYLHDTLKIEYYECEIDPNVMRITIRGNEKESEIISYRSNLFDPQVVDKMQDVLHSVLKAEDVLVSLQKKGYHLYKNPRNDNSFFAYIEGEKFEIKLAIERLVECRVSFEKLTGKKLTLDFDHMDGHAFERFCADILVGNGFESVRVTQGSGDQGIDIIAFKDGIKYGIQCKCYSSDIGNKAVQEAFAGKTFYDCHVGIVLTNQHFTSHAIELAKKNGIVLWDRNKLLTMIKKANN